MCIRDRGRVAAGCNAAALGRRRSEDLKIGRIGMMAVMGCITPEPAWKFPGFVSPFLGFEYAGFPSGFAAVPKVTADWAHLAAYLGHVATGTAFANAGLGMAVCRAPMQAENKNRHQEFEDPWAPSPGLPQLAQIHF